MITVDIRDEATPLIKSYLANNPKMIASLTKSIGWYVQSNVKKLSTSTLPSRWADRVPLKIRRKLDNKAPKAWLGKLKRAIGYAYNPASKSVAIGWTSSTAAREGKIQEFGARRQVTPRLQSFFASRGVPLSERKKQIDVPARPIFEPAMEVIHPQLGSYIQNKVASYMENGGHARTSGKRRKYEVYT